MIPHLHEVEDVDLSRVFGLAGRLDRAQPQSLSVGKVLVSPAKDVRFTVAEDSTEKTV